MGIDLLHHVQLAMPAGGEARARAFYASIPGIPEVPEPAGSARRGGCWFDTFIADPFGTRIELLEPVRS